MLGRYAMKTRGIRLKHGQSSSSRTYIGAWYVHNHDRPHHYRLSFQLSFEEVVFILRDQSL
jgi:hypothetical protein